MLLVQPDLSECRWWSRWSWVDAFICVRHAGNLRSDLITTYKILFGHTIIDSNKFFRIKNYNITRGHKYKLINTNAHCDAFRYSFTQRTISLWNSLPASTNFSTIRNFINSLSFFNLLKTCKGRKWHNLLLFHAFVFKQFLYFIVYTYCKWHIVSFCRLNVCMYIIVPTTFFDLPLGI